MAKKKTIAIISIHSWGRRIAAKICKDRRFSLVSLVGSFSEEVWAYAQNKAPFDARDNGGLKDAVLTSVVKHGLVPSIKEAEGEEEDESTESYKKTVDLVVVDMGDLNPIMISAIKKHVNDRVIAHASDPTEKRYLEELGAYAVCPDLESADNVIPLLIDTHVTRVGDELGEWDGAVMPIPDSWTGRTVQEIETERGVVIVLVKSESTTGKTTRRKNTPAKIFHPEKSYVFTSDDVEMKVVSSKHENLVKIEEELD